MSNEKNESSSTGDVSAEGKAIPPTASAAEGQDTPTNPPSPSNAATEVEVEELDWSGKPQEDHTKSPELAGDYDPRPKEDEARRHIAYLLIGLLWVVVSSIFILVTFGSVTVSDIKEFAVVLGPIVTLVSAATGFYYGTKTK